MNLDIARKIELLTGMTTWVLHPRPEVGLRSLVLSDGPVGVRGTGEGHSLLFPSPSAVAATWDPAVADRLGHLFAVEARRHGVDVVLAPQVNIQRTPYAGRHFECFSEDPLLTAEIAGPLVAGIQRHGVAACVKHYVLNDSERDRTRYVARADERALREVYLAPFERVVREAGVWSVMAAYNRADAYGDDSPMTAHAPLLRDVLKGEWAFDGVVVSDWMATTATVGPANGGLDLVMPGPGGPWDEELLAAVKDGRVPESVIDDKVARILRLAARTGGQPTPVFGDDRAFLRELAARSTVVLRRHPGGFPAAPAAVRSVAVIGPNAATPFVLGGGSSVVSPRQVVGVPEAFAAALPHAEVTLARGGDARVHLPPADLASLGHDPEGGPGVARMRAFDAAGALLSSVTLAEWDGWDRAVPAEVETVELHTVLRLAEPGDYRIELGTVGRFVLRVDDVVVASGDEPAGPEVFLDSSVNAPPGRGADLVVHEPRDVDVRAVLTAIPAEGFGRVVRGELRLRPPGPTVEDEIAEAVALARRCDLVVVVVGTNSDVESEGWDRTCLALPGRQDELVDRILAVAPDAVVAVNAGAPVVLPWLTRAATVLWTWFPGQEAGAALADVVLGRAEPAGRLPWTLPADEADVPTPRPIPGDDLVLSYPEGIHVGYRGWLRAGAEPAAPFGHGLGWTDWRYETADVATAGDDDLAVTVQLTNTGTRPGTEVVQCYLEPVDPASAPERPLRWLAGATVVTAGPAETVTATVRVRRRARETWDPAARRWVVPAQALRARLGRSVTDLRLTIPLDA
ncbi:glycoside hydrolase family 3 protein [Asanoa iriomotensis]|uniref:Beta-glucosidase n=1 Tax=Asanoa iriomotensis TaxID=234613 RepID=A0ABQ4BU91_9ACTN|nr:glycoside hydrolase family 3 N-terminal domain-containing protein [Asanoa iriomotensis]GIF54088.1 beta-glucosidase [Asanoa iriomotensis]